MERFAAAYGRALFPNRYGLRNDSAAPGTGVDGGPHMTLPPAGLDLAIGAGVYRLVYAVEALLGGLRRRTRRVGAATTRPPTATPLGCG